MNFSASDLCKRSAAQIFYLRNHPNKVYVTPEQVAGIKKQANNSKSKYCEMGGAYRFNGDDVIYFSWDEIILNVDSGKAKFVEHKQVLGEPAPWFKNSSILQTALYAALAVGQWEYKTSLFHILNGNPKYKIDLFGYSRNFYLQFGEDIYKIRLVKSQELRDFLTKKALASKKYDTAIEFDRKYKHKEFELLKKCFTFNKCV